MGLQGSGQRKGIEAQAPGGRVVEVDGDALAGIPARFDPRDLRYREEAILESFRMVRERDHVVRSGESDQHRLGVHEVVVERRRQRGRRHVYPRVFERVLDLVPRAVGR